MRYLYKKDDGGVAIIVGASKDKLEQELGPMTDEQYKEKIKSSAPAGSVGRFISESDYPESREFRDAWSDITEGTKIDIDAEKAKSAQLERLRAKRDKKLQEADKESLLAIEAGDESEITKVKEKKRKLRDATEGLKNLKAKGAADESLLAEIRRLGTIS